jgi:hypothetical protein
MKKLVGKYYEVSFWPDDDYSDIYGERKPIDEIAGTPYIIGSDGTLYRVSREERLAFMERLERVLAENGFSQDEINCFQIDGQAVSFESPEKKKGKYRWAYNICHEPVVIKIR